MNIREAAAELNTTPKALRRFLRKSHGGAVVGLGGSYDLSRDQVNALRGQIKETPIMASDPHPELNQSQGFDPELLVRMRKDPRLKAEVLEMRRARRARLIARMQEPEVAEFFSEKERERLAALDRQLSTQEV